MTPEERATDFYIEFNTVCQGDDTLPHDVAKWVLKLLREERAENERLTEQARINKMAIEDLQRDNERLARTEYGGEQAQQFRAALQTNGE